MAGRRIVVTGAFGVLGAAVAKAAAADGDRLALLDFAPAPPDGLVAACGPGVFVRGGVDLTDPVSAGPAMDAAAAKTKFSRLDKNKDGSLSSEEFAPTRKPRAKKETAAR